MRVTRLFPLLRKIESGAVVLAFGLLALFPFLEVITRKFLLSGIPGASRYTFHLVFWITFLGGMVTTYEGKHISLSLGFTPSSPFFRNTLRVYNSHLSAVVCFILGGAALSFAVLGFDPGQRVGFIPIRLAVAVMPLAYAVMGIRFLSSPSQPLPPTSKWVIPVTVLAAVAFSLPTIVNLLEGLSVSLPSFTNPLLSAYEGGIQALFWPLFILLLVSALMGTPIFVVIGGITCLLFAHEGGSLEVVSNEAYTLLTGPIFPAIPLFTFAGFVLSESHAGERLFNLFQALLGWLPGGVAVMTVLVCAFFTTFTGASGVTILSLGTLLSFALVSVGFKEGNAQGLVTASGSIGLLFPPSLPIILYGIIAHVNIKHMFIGGVLPGLLMVLALSLIGVALSLKAKKKAVPFRWRSVVGASKGAIWEILLPILILYGFFSGLTTLIETGGVAVIYVVIVECFVNKDLRLRDLIRVSRDCITILGGIMIILAVARALSFYIIDAQIPFHLKAWIQANIHSKYVFLALLNLGLIVTGCLMDIFSAIVVVVPLILPLSELFGIHPLHLGIIFLANLELGYLTPPVGLNLFMASYRFNQPMSRVYKNMLPYFLALLGTLLVITYIPALTTFFLK